MTSFPTLKSWKEGTENSLYEINECYCPNCGRSNAHTILFPTKIPMFREIYIMSLKCEDCHFQNSEVNFGGQIQSKGLRIKLHSKCLDDLNRQIIKSDYAKILIPQLKFEIPAMTQRGSISTIEGILRRAAENLKLGQTERLKLGDLNNFYRCQNVIEKLMSLIEDYSTFDLILDDPAGNSYIERSDVKDSQLMEEMYTRSSTQDMELGLQPSSFAIAAGIIDETNETHKNIVNDPSSKIEHVINLDDKQMSRIGNLGKQEALKFSTPCPSCQIQTYTIMCVTDIPHFKEVILMNLSCDNCGYKSSEIKGGGAIPKLGTTMILNIRQIEDLEREVLKSDTAGIELPDIDLKLDEGSLGGFYTTVEGLIEKIHCQLCTIQPFYCGDAMRKHHNTNDGEDFSPVTGIVKRYTDVLNTLTKMKKGTFIPFSITISDPLSNSFFGPIPSDALKLSQQAESQGNTKCYETYVDGGLVINEYERTDEQNEKLGLNDMNTEKYQNVPDSTIENKFNYVTDEPQELPDRLRHIDMRLSDHPHMVAKAPVKDDIVMGPGSKSFPIPALYQRETVNTEKIK